jgi:hypothetical protein
LATLQKRFDGGERGLPFLKDYLMRLEDGTPAFEAAINVFKPSMEGEGLLNEYSWEVFKKYFWKPTTPYATYFLENRAKFEAKYDKMEVQEKAIGLYANLAGVAVQDGDEEAYRNALVKIRTSGLPEAENIALNSEMFYYQTKEDWKGYANSAGKLIDRLQGPKAMTCNAVAWTMYEGTGNKKLLKKALQFAEQSVSENEEYENMDTKAMLLLKLGKKQEGIAAAERALELAKAAGHPEEYWIETKNALEAAKAE